MYIHIETKCSKCKAVDDFRTIIDGAETITECKSCGHKKSETTFTTLTSNPLPEPHNPYDSQIIEF